MVRGLSAAVAGIALLTSGCGALDRFEDGGATVFIFATHHATPENGSFPDRGIDNMPRTFPNSEGWEVTLLEAYVTISAVTLIGCNGSEHEMRMFWGPCPEDLRDEDLATLTVAGNHVPEGDYCALEVQYAAYQPPVIDEDADDTRHEVPSNEGVQGASIYLRGGAQFEGGEFTNFELKSPATLTVELDISEVEGPGQPLNVAHREDFPKELLVSKTYDRFFDGVDFEAFDGAAVEALLPQVLREQTKVSAGTVVDLPEDQQTMDPPMGG